MRDKYFDTLKHTNLGVRAVPSLSLTFDAVLSVVVALDSAAITDNVSTHGGYMGWGFDHLPSAHRGSKFVLLTCDTTLVSNARIHVVLHLLCVRAIEELHTSRGALWPALQAACSPFAVELFFSYFLRALRVTLYARDCVTENTIITVMYIIAQRSCPCLRISPSV